MKNGLRLGLAFLAIARPAAAPDEPVKPILVVADYFGYV